MKQQHKPIIETLINTAAIALTTLGVQQITVGNLLGYAAISFGVLLEFLKYLGRNKDLW